MKTSVFLLLVVVVVFAIPAAAAERHMMQPRVPADKLAEARALRSPLSNSPETIDQGKAIYNGKGTCFTCHGVDGDGKGHAGVKLNPAPVIFSTMDFGAIAPKANSSGSSNMARPAPAWSDSGRSYPMKRSGPSFNLSALFPGNMDQV